MMKFFHPGWSRACKEGGGGGGGGKGLARVCALPGHSRFLSIRTKCQALAKLLKITLLSYFKISGKRYFIKNKRWKGKVSSGEKRPLFNWEHETTVRFVIYISLLFSFFLRRNQEKELKKNGFVSDICLQYLLRMVLSRSKGSGTLTWSPLGLAPFVGEEVTVHNTGISILLSTNAWFLLSTPMERRESRKTA